MKHGTVTRTARTTTCLATGAVAALLGLAVALQRRVIHAWLRARGVNGVGFDEVVSSGGTTLFDLDQVTTGFSRFEAR